MSASDDHDQQSCRFRTKRGRSPFALSDVTGSQLTLAALLWRGTDELLTSWGIESVSDDCVDVQLSSPVDRLELQKSCSKRLQLLECNT